MKWIALLLALICCTLCVTADVQAQQCFNGVCYGQPIIYAQPIYQPAPVIIVSKPIVQQPDSPHPDGQASPAIPLEQTVIVAPDPRFAQCGPHGCYRPAFEPRPCFGPQCHPQQPAFIQTRRTFGVGLNVSWNSRRSWR